MTKRVMGHVPLIQIWSVVCLLTQVIAVQRDQGISDSRAYIGRIFTLKIPKNAFQGAIEKLDVTEAGESRLPSWLEFDADHQIFKGVPSTTDAGQLYVCVKAIAGSSSAKDVFSIEITEDAPSADYCPFGKDETTATIVIDATLPDLKSQEKFYILQSVARFLGATESRLQLLALRRDESAFDPDAIRAGPGNALQRNYEGTQIKFKVGCAGEISPESEQILDKLEKSSSNGELSDRIGYLIVGWQVSSAMKLIPLTRDKRNVAPFLHATPVPKVHITRWPTFTERIDEAETREIVPEIRIVPTMSSPRFVGHTYDHRHRHHHGLDPLRRERIFLSAEVHPSPTYHYHPLPSSRRETGGTPVVTPVLLPERPTISIRPTRIYDIDGTVSITQERPSLASEDSLSRWYVPTSDYTTVDILPTRSHVTVEPTKIMPQMPNFKPTVNSRTKKLSLVAGKAWSYTIPIDTFIDMEDGNTRDLKLMFMTAERTSLSASSWIQFDPENQVIYALPLSDNIGKHEFVLEAMDSEGASTFDRVELHVWQHPQADTLTHSFTMTVKYNKWQYPVGIDWQIEVLNRLALLFEDRDNSKLSMLAVTLDPVKITWTNDSLPTDHCPLQTITQLYDIIASSEHHPTKEMKKLVHPEFRVQDINVKHLGACEGVVKTPPPPLNFSPILKKPIQRINVTVGDIVKFKIPENTFYDFEDGPTRHLRLTLLTSDNVQPPKSYWLQFDPRSQEIYGIPFETEIGRHDFVLNAVDSDDHMVPDNFFIHVSRFPRRKPPVEFSIQFDYDFDEFQSDTSKKTLVASKIARLYGDPDPRYMLITNISRGSVVYAWSNKTLGNDYCPQEKINQLVKYIINDDGTLSTNLIQIMEPEFRVVSADAVPTGVCLGGVAPTFVTITTTTPQPTLSPDEIEPTLKTSTDDDIYITTIVPAIVIAVMLVIAAIVAYFLYWKKRKGKMSLGDKDFIGSGVPVVFAGELEEQKPDPGKAPAIMKNEKPPLSTDYLFNPFRRTAAVQDSVPQTAPKNRDGSYPRDRKENANLYKPPPPFTSSREPKSTRPKSTQAYRHATYVPP